MNRFLPYLLYSTLVLFILGQLGRIHIPDRPIYFYLYEVIVALISILLLFVYRAKPLRKVIGFHPLSMFLSWMGVSLIISFFFYSFDQNTIAVLYAARIVMYAVLFLYGKFYIDQTKLSLKKPLIIASSVILVGSIGQYFLYPDIGNIAYLGWDPHISRLVGVFLDPPIAAAMFFLCGWYLVNRLFQSKKIYYGVIMLVVTFIFIILTYSRGAFFALIGAVVLYGITLKRYFIAGIAVLSIIVIIFLIPKAQTESINLLRTTSITARLDDYKKGVEIWQKNPIFGIGYNHIRFEKEKYVDDVFVEDYNPSHGIASFHSSFMNILATGGMVGLALFLYLLFTLARKSTFFLISIGFLSMLSLFDNVLLHPYVILFLGMMYLAED